MAFNKWKTGNRLKLEWRYVICPLTFLIVLWVAASFYGALGDRRKPISLIRIAGVRMAEWAAGFGKGLSVAGVGDL